MSYMEFFLDFIKELTIPVAFASGGALIRLYDQYKKQKKMHLIKEFFGESAFEPNQLIVTLPVFHPLTSQPSSDFEVEKNASFVKKTNITLTGELEEKKVPMFSKTIVLDDYYGLEKIQELFAQYGLSEIGYVEDEELVGKWTVYPCIVCIGGPRSNQKQNEIINHIPNSPNLLTLGQSAKSLGEWRLKIFSKSRSLLLGVDENSALGVIYRIPNPVQPSNMLVGILGCRGQSTRNVCEFFKDNFKMISDKARHHPFVLVTAIPVKEDELPKIPKLIYFATSEEELISDDEELKRYLREEETE